ncbi:MAG TPA: carbohydrate ABC transporter permease [Ruminiclostridium sp.]
MKIKSILAKGYFNKLIWYVLMTIFALIFSMPLIWLFLTAFKTPQQTVAFPPEWIPNPWTFRSFVEGFADGSFGKQICNSIIVTLLCLIGTLVSSSLVGFGFSRLQARFKNFLFIVLLGTMMIPSTVTLIPTYVLYSKLGLINTYVPLVIPSFLGVGAFSIFLAKQFFDTLPKELDEASMIDGCSWFKTFALIYIPNSKPLLIVISIFSFVGTWNDFFSPMIFLLDPDKYTLAVGLAMFRNQYGGASDIGPLMAMSLVSILPVFILFFIAQKYFVQGIATTGLK